MSKGSKSPEQKRQKGYIKGLKDATTKAQSDLDQLRGDPYHGEGYLEGWSDGLASRDRRGLNR